mgnify:CR=1 FL=1
MDFEFTQEEEALRSQVQAFIKDNLTPEVLADLAEDDSEYYVARGVQRVID